ncbi:MAG: hypothetical protein WBZ36_07055, partial [Candidatus Nitrosopolaris sp.]
MNKAKDYSSSDELDTYELPLENYITSRVARKIMRGRWAMAAVGAGVARRRASGEMEQERQAHESQQDQA